MGEQRPPQLDRWGFRFLLVAISVAAGALLFLQDWFIPPTTDTSYWNGLLAFVLLGIACDSSFLPISRISFARLGTSVAFIPFLASALLFAHPWPMIGAGIAAVVAQTVVRRKPFLRVWFNTAQYMLAIGLGGLAYSTLGGHIGFTGFAFSFIPFAVLVLVFFAVNQGAVSLALSVTSDIPLTEAWARLVGKSLLYDLVSSSLAILLSFLFIKLQVIGLAILVLPLFFVRHMYQMNLQVERVNRELLELMVKSIEARDPYTSGHSLRVSEYARQIAREFGLTPSHVDQIGTAALLHDVGKIYEEFAPLLRKEGRLTPEERMLMQAHPVRSADLAGTIAEFRGRVQTDIRNHHENYDGSGYPDGLAGESIPIGARIIMVADTLDAMTTDRPYRSALTLQRTLEELNKHAGRQFDPRLVAIVSKSASLRRLLGPQLTTETTALLSMNSVSRNRRPGIRTGP
jgi:putative nucleotidyltransferase with HDIG domain